MQLLKVQERINALPLNAASLSYLDRAAKGMDTEIPPFMALAGMNEMKRNMEYASTGQPPEEPINESLPKKVAQQMGLGQPMQPMQPGQPMQPPGQQLAQGIAQPMQQQMPQQMARGGLASVPIDPRMFDYRSGGIIAFDGNTDGSLVPKLLGVEGAEQDEDGDESPVPTTQELNALRKRLEGMLGQPAPTLASADEIRKQLEARNQYGVDPGPVGQQYLRGLDTIQKGQVEEDAKIAEDNARLKNIGISRALIRAGEGTRGGGGIAGLLGAFGESYAGVQEEDIKRSADLRDRDLARADVLNEATYAIQKLREAQRNGDEKGVMEQNQKLADLANKLNISKNELMGKLFLGETNLLKAKIAADKGTRPTDLASGVEEGLRAARALGDTRNDDVIREIVRNRLITAGAATAAGAAILGQASQAATATSAQDLTEDQHNTARRGSAIDNVDKRLADPRNQFARELRRLQREDQAFNNPPTPLIGDAPPKPAVRQDKAGEYREKLYEKEYEKLPPFRRATSGTPAPGAATTYPVPNASAINALKSNQGSPEQCDAIFGPGAARKILGK